MNAIYNNKMQMSLLVVLIVAFGSLSACSSGQENTQITESEVLKDGFDASGFLVSLEEEPDTVDFQCTSIHYTIAQNVFNRLVEMSSGADGEAEFVPSLAESWEVSEDGCTYTFHLREAVRFSNGAPLTSSDVGYTLTRLLTHPDSCNQDIVEMILGAKELESGEASELQGFKILSDLDFNIRLEQPFEAFLACMSMPAASILDQETTEEAGDRFGIKPEWTVGTGSFILKSWEEGKRMILTANPDCWEGPPCCDGLDLRFMTDAESVREMFDDGELDILDLDELGDLSEYFIHGDIYQDRLQQVRQIGIMYIALNEYVAPLDDVRVRKALQLALNRPVLLDTVYSGRGTVENGIFPHGLYGYNPDLPEIPYDPEKAKKLLEEAGYPDGFELKISVKSSSTQLEYTLMTAAASMWEKIGIHTTVEILDESEFMSLRKSGTLTCYTATWTADYNDPDNFIYTFFGNRKNTIYRSLCYQNDEIMKRVQNARTILDQKIRLEEYQELEKILIQEDAAWIPLFSRNRYYVTGERLEGFQAAWNGSVKANYRYMSVNRLKDK